MVSENLYTEYFSVWLHIYYIKSVSHVDSTLLNTHFSMIWQDRVKLFVHFFLVEMTLVAVWVPPPCVFCAITFRVFFSSHLFRDKQTTSDHICLLLSTVYMRLYVSDDCKKQMNKNTSQRKRVKWIESRVSHKVYSTLAALTTWHIGSSKCWCQQQEAEYKWTKNLAHSLINLEIFWYQKKI